MKILEGLQWSPKWVSHLGCVKGCLKYLGIDISGTWLYGGTGHAFIINISKDSCPSGPTAWKTTMLFELAPNLGYEISGVFGSKYNQDLSDLQEQAWEFTRKSIDDGLPIYGWEIEIPEFYVINGYDDKGYYYSGPGADEGRGPKVWHELGDTGIGLVELYQVKPVPPKKSDTVIKKSFETVLEHAQNPSDWLQENYAFGIKGYEYWIEGLENGISNRFGMGYNAAVWSECRTYAVEFLKEAKVVLPDNLSSVIDEGIKHYSVVADRLEKISNSFSWTPAEGNAVIPVDQKCHETIGWLKEARESESMGLEILQKISEAI